MYTLPHVASIAHMVMGWGSISQRFQLSDQVTVMAHAFFSHLGLCDSSHDHGHVHFYYLDHQLIYNWRNLSDESQNVVKNLTFFRAVACWLFFLLLVASFKHKRIVHIIFQSFPVEAYLKNQCLMYSMMIQLNSLILYELLVWSSNYSVGLQTPFIIP